MEDAFGALTLCPLFAGLSRDEIITLARRTVFTFRTYAKGEVIAFEEDDCTWVGVIARGSIQFQRIYPSGRVITLDTLPTGSSFGEALIFTSEGRYPATLVAGEATEVIVIPREEAERYCVESTLFVRNLLRMVSNRVLMLNRRIKGLSYATVRQKVANYLLEECTRQGKDEISLPYSRSELADVLGIPRPSLSRELIALKEDGLIDFDKRTVCLLNRDALEQSLRV